MDYYTDPVIDNSTTIVYRDLNYGNKHLFLWINCYELKMYRAIEVDDDALRADGVMVVSVDLEDHCIVYR